MSKADSAGIPFPKALRGRIENWRTEGRILAVRLAKCVVMGRIDGRCGCQVGDMGREGIACVLSTGEL